MFEKHILYAIADWYVYKNINNDSDVNIYNVYYY